MNEERIPFDHVVDVIMRSQAQSRLTFERMERFVKRRIDTNDMVQMTQDLMDARALQFLPEQFAVAATHCIRQGLCTVAGSYLH